MAERTAFKSKMPQIELQLCLFHVLKNFEREITTTKRGISEIERKRVLAILKDMACIHRQRQNI